AVEFELEIDRRKDEEESDMSLTKLIEEKIKTLDDIRLIVENKNLGASEDIVYMMEKVHQQGGKAAYMLFGSPIPAGHHQPNFDFDERVLEIGVNVFTHLVVATYENKEKL